jgi:hypothetical protein
MAPSHTAVLNWTFGLGAGLPLVLSAARIGGLRNA